MDAETQPPAPVVGPFEIINLAGANGVPQFSGPYASLAGANIVCRVVESVLLAVPPVPTEYAPLFFGGEISIWGSVHGAWDLLKVQFVRNLSGPMRYRVPTDEPYDQIEIRARAMAGGKSMPSGVTQAAGYSAQLTIFIRANPAFNVSNRGEPFNRGRR